MMGKSWGLQALVILAAVSTASSACDDFDAYFGDVSSVSEINLDVTTVECPGADGTDQEEILIESGKTLTISTTGAFLQFINIRFTVEDGASLIFDTDDTRFGPNADEESENSGGFMLDVQAGGSATFAGQFSATSIENVRSVFYNAGSIEFKGDASFIANDNVFRSNLGTLKFRGDTVFSENYYLAIDNEGPDAFVRFSKTATFYDNAGSFEGVSGGAVSNREGTVIFRDTATFSNHRCDDGGAVFNAGKMRFFGKARFNDNVSFRGWGGGLENTGGTLIFTGAAQFNRNMAEVGGGLAVSGGEVIFKKAVKFDSNGADENGGAFSVTVEPEYGTADTPGSLTFRKSGAVSYTGNYIDASTTPVTGCSLAYVEEGTTLTGFDVDDVCVEVTV